MSQSDPFQVQRFQAQMSEACLRLLKIPVLGALIALLFISVISGDWIAAISFSVLACFLLYLPLLGLLYFESKNWVQLEEQGLRLYIDQEEHFFSWQEIAYIHNSREALRISLHHTERHFVVHYLAAADKERIYSSYFDRIGLKPNQEQFSDEHPSYLNWDRNES